MAQQSKSQLHIGKFKHTFREGRAEREQLAVCSPEFHRELAAVHWGKLISTMGVQAWPDAPDMRLGNCPVCNTTLSKPPKA
jgi:hypothetical protein